MNETYYTLHFMLERLEDARKRADDKLEDASNEFRWIESRAILSAHIEMTIDGLKRAMHRIEPSPLHDDLEDAA